MPLQAGARLGPYEILALIGAGGMGEVYRARDTRLNREVAIKALPASVAGDPDRLARFQREAEALAGLNHPNIVTIHSVDELDGHLLLTMELVAGRSLADILPSEGLPLNRVLRIAIPVADAMVAAHQKGITHRDLKPANIMLGEGDQDGRVKVLDFGLAKLADAPFAAGGATALPTAAITGEGRILGTVAYMSPEQAEGKPVDARSDLFSLGVILYEMATGRRPFTGDTSISIISSIIKDTPRSVTELNPRLPRDLGRIIRRALTKDVTRRYQTAADLRNDLEELKRSLDSGELAEPPASEALVRQGKPRVPAWGIAAAALLGVAAMVAIGLVRRQQESTPSAGTASVAPPSEMVALTSTGNALRPVLSPDGKYVAYVQLDDLGQSLWVRQIASGGNARVVEPIADRPILATAVTPDGGSIDFVRRVPGQGDQAELWRVPFPAGTPRRLIDNVGSAPGWSSDGRKMAFVTVKPGFSETSLVVADADGTNQRIIATRRLPRDYMNWARTTNDARPVWLPDGHEVAVIGFDNAAGQLIRVNRDTGSETVMALTGFPVGLALAPDGRGFVLDLGADALHSARLIRTSLSGSEPTSVTTDLSDYVGISISGGAAATSRRQTRVGLWLTSADGNSARQVGSDLTGSFGDLAFAADNRLIYTAKVAGGNGLWSVDLTAGGSPSLIVLEGSNPETSVDGRILMFSRRRDNTAAEVWRADADGTHQVRVVADASEAAITPDGSTIFFHSLRSGRPSLWVTDAQGGSARLFYEGAGAAVSPNGKLVAIRSVSGDHTVIIPVAGGEPVRRLDVNSHRWTPDGSGLAFIATNNVWIQPIDGRPSRQLTHFTDGQQIFNLAFSHDGKQLSLIRGVSTRDIVLLKGIK